MAALLVIASLRAAEPRPALMPVATAPLKVKGTHFVARERVHVRVTAGDKTLSRRARAGRGGSFTVTSSGVDACSGLEGTAAGSRGSRASFQFSSFVC